MLDAYLVVSWHSLQIPEIKPEVRYSAPFSLSLIWLYLALISTHPPSILSSIHQRRSTQIEPPYLFERPFYQSNCVHISQTPSDSCLSYEVSLQDWGFRTPKGYYIPITCRSHSSGRFNPPLVSRDNWTRPIRCRSSGANCRHRRCGQEITDLEFSWIARIIGTGLWTTLRCGFITVCW